MRLFVLTPRFPHPLDKGDKLRAYHQIVELAKRHEVVLCALSDRPVSPGSRKELVKLCRRVEVLEFPRWRGWLRAAIEVVGRRPLQVAYFHDPHLARTVRALIAEEAPDHVYCQLVRTAEYLEGVAVPRTLDLMDAFSWGMAQRHQQRPGWLGPLLGLESRRLRSFETAVVDRFERCTVITAADRDHIAHPQRARIAVVANGVDLETFRPRSTPTDVDLLFVGNMGYPPNADAAEVLVREVLPHVRERFPETRVLIAGATPTARVRRLAGVGVEVTGWVDDIAGCYARARVFVNPMRFGTGLQNKLLQAMAMGVPCVSTPMGDRALGAAPHGLRIATDPSAIAAACVELLADPVAARELGLAGQRFAANNCSWANAAADLERVLLSSAAVTTPGQTPTDG
jgi:sugar transferase (PEP-CTERM/EpsH1 system associated)